MTENNEYEQLEMQFRQVKTWDDLVQMAADMRKADDELKFALGDLVRLACPARKSGRPALSGQPDGSRAETLTALAAAMDIDRSELSNLAANAEFWNLDVRGEIPPTSSWRHCAKARKASGWKPGKPASGEQVQVAFEALFSLEEKPREKPERSLESLAHSVVRVCDLMLARRPELGDALSVVERTRKEWKEMQEWIST